MHGTAEVELDLALCELVGDRAGVGQRAREPVELGDDERVARAACGEGLVQAGALAVGAGEAVVDVDALGLHAERLEPVALGGEILLVGGDAGVADVQAGHRGGSMPYSPRSSRQITEPVLRDPGCPVVAGLRPRAAEALCVPVGVRLAANVAHHPPASCPSG